MSNAQQTNDLPETVWHYTKMDVLEKIFLPKGNKERKKGDIKIRFVNSRYLNDPSESLILRELLLKNEENIIKEYDLSKEDFDKYIKNSENCFWNYYVFSTSCRNDSFAFWSKEYAGTNGIAIGFDAKKFKEKADEIQSNIELQPALFERVCYINYDESIEKIDKDANSRYENTLVKNFKEMFAMLNKSDALMHLLGNYSCIYKFRPWEHEQEVRVVLEDGDKERADSKKLHREKIDEEENLNANIEFINGEVTKVCYKYFDKNIVKSITLGPDCGQEHIEAVKEYLTRNGYDKIDVLRSKAFDLRYKPC